MSELTHINRFQLMAQYNSWANDRLYELGSSLSEDERNLDRKAFFKSIHGTLNRILLADSAWLGRFATSTSYTFPSLQEAKLVLKR